MRRIIAAALLVLFLGQSSGVALAAQPANGNAPALAMQLAMAFRPLLGAIQGSQIVAIFEGQGNRYAAMHAPPPNFSAISRAIIVAPEKTRVDHHVQARFVGSGVLLHLQMSASMSSARGVRDPLAISKQNPSGPSIAHTLFFMTPTPPRQLPASVTVGQTSFVSIGQNINSSSITSSTCQSIATLTFTTVDISGGYNVYGAAPGQCSAAVSYSTTTAYRGSAVINVTVSAAPTPTPTPVPVATPTPCPGGWTGTAPNCTAPAPTPAPTATPQLALPMSSTGINHWWTYEEGGIPGAGRWMLNVANGNALVQDDDIDVPERGIDLAFRRTYNSQSKHDYANSDGSVASNYGNGWTNTFDAHLAYNANGPTISVYDIDGARYDYVASNGAWVAPSGMQGTSLTWDGGCGYQWTKKNGTIYYFWEPFGTSTACGFPSPHGAHMGRLYQIIGRNHNNTVTFQYSWTNGDASSAANLAQIVAVHSDGQQLVLSFADVNGHRLLSSITRPDGQVVHYAYDANANLTDVCNIGNGYSDASPGAAGVCGDTTHRHHRYGWNANHQIAWADSPKWTMTWGAGDSTGSGGAYVTFAYDGSNRLSALQNTGYVNIVPNDGTNTWLQPAAATGIQTFRSTTVAYGQTNAWGQPATSLYDSDGHVALWGYDSFGRILTTQRWASANFNLYTKAAWDQNNNLIATTDPRGNETDYGYDGNGNTLWVQEPPTQTNWGSIRPVARYSYDQFNNLISYCDPVYVGQTGNPVCPSSGAVTYYRYAYPGAEPYGELTDSYTPLGYHRWYSYNVNAQGGQDFGLPTDVNSDSFAQLDGTTVAPHTGLSYDADGNIKYYGSGVGNWTLAYDGLNRLVTATDPDNVTSRTCYNTDNSVSAKQSALQYSLDGVPCGANSVSFGYDADGNTITENHHYGGTLGTTQKWYDGEGRLVEVSLPPGDSTDYNGHGLTRYLYDLSQNGNGAGTLGFSGAASVYSAHGGLYKTQACYAQGAPTCPSWTDVKGQAFDSLDRLVTRYQHVPGQSTIAQYTWTYDADPNTLGLLSYSFDAMNVKTTHAYTAIGNDLQISFSDSTPIRSYTYDADARPTQITSSSYGGVSYTYDQDGQLTTKQEAAGTNMTSPAMLTYGYYPNGLRKALSVSSQALSQANLLQYAYRVDGKRTWLKYANEAKPFAWTYTNAGRPLSQGDPYTGLSVPMTIGATTYNEQLGSMQWSYDLGTTTNTGALTTLKMPVGGTYASIAHDPESNPTSMNIVAPPGVSYSVTSVGNQYDARGQHSKTAYGQAGGAINYDLNILEQFSYTAGYGVQVGHGIPTVDVPTGAALQISDGTPCMKGTPRKTNLTYDLDGRISSRSSSIESCNTGTWSAFGADQTYGTYDAENHILYSAGPLCPLGDTGCDAGNPQVTLAWGPEAHPVTAMSPGGQQRLTFHWDGDDLLFASSFDGSLYFVGVEMLAASYTQGATGMSPLYVQDRDFAGQTAQQHTSAQALQWQYAPPRRFLINNDIAYASYSQGGPFIGMIRADGYQIADTTVQGVRAYDPSVGQWTTPDAYQGEAHDPMSQRSYMWNNNNPVEYSDPTGYVPVAIPIAGSVACPECVPLLAIGAAIGAGLALLHRAYQKAQETRETPDPKPAPAPPGGSTSSPPPESLLGPGPNAGEGIEIQAGQRPTAEQQREINKQGDTDGCHSGCGATTPGTKSGKWVTDHQPPSATNAGGAGRGYPQCLACSRRQGGVVRGVRRRPPTN